MCLFYEAPRRLPDPGIQSSHHARPCLPVINHKQFHKKTLHMAGPTSLTDLTAADSI